MEKARKKNDVASAIARVTVMSGEEAIGGSHSVGGVRRGVLERIGEEESREE